jgi:hypothetical protein
MIRPLTKEEITLIKLFAEKLNKKQENQIMADMKNATAEIITEAGGSIICFHINGYERPEKGGQDVIAEGTIKDQGNIPVTILLFTDCNDRLYELEFIRWDGTEGDKIIKLDWLTLTILDAPLV